jgi:hypothetical protein
MDKIQYIKIKNKSRYVNFQNRELSQEDETVLGESIRSRITETAQSGRN